MTPVVTVIVPFFNRFNLLPQIVGTIADQTLQDWELIIVDDHSTDDVAAAVRPFNHDPRIRLLSLANNVGPAAARNRGVEAARGRFVAFLDSDDSWYPGKLEAQVKAVEASEALTTICMTLTEVRMPGGWTRVLPRRSPYVTHSFAEFLYCDDGFAQTSSILVPTALARAHPFVEGLHQYEDHLFLMRIIASGGKCVIIPQILTVWHNDERADRLSSYDDLVMGQRFLKHAKQLLSTKAETAFKVRVLGVETLHAHPIDGLRLISSALASRAVTPRQVAAVLVRKTLPRWFYDHWRQREEARFRRSQLL